MIGQQGFSGFLVAAAVLGAAINPTPVVAETSGARELAHKFAIEEERSKRLQAKREAAAKEKAEAEQRAKAEFAEAKAKAKAEAERAAYEVELLARARREAELRREADRKMQAEAKRAEAAAARAADSARRAAEAAAAAEARTAAEAERKRLIREAEAARNAQRLQAMQQERQKELEVLTEKLKRAAEDRKARKAMAKAKAEEQARAQAAALAEAKAKAAALAEAKANAEALAQAHAKAKAEAEERARADALTAARAKAVAAAAEQRRIAAEQEQIRRQAEIAAAERTRQEADRLERLAAEERARKAEQERRQMARQRFDRMEEERIGRMSRSVARIDRDDDDRRVAERAPANRFDDDYARRRADYVDQAERIRPGNGGDRWYDRRDGDESDSLGGNPARDTRVTVLLLMKPGRRGIRRFNRTADPVLCSTDGCYLSQGASAPASFVSQRRALGGKNTFGRRAAACNHSLGCVFRNVALNGNGTVLQPVDLRMIHHDRRQAQTISNAQRCSPGNGRLRCEGGIVARDYVMWIVPERIAETAGEQALENAISEGLRADFISHAEGRGFRYR